MAARRKAPRRRARKSFNISAVEAGAAISLLQSTGAAGSVQQALGGDLTGAVNNLSSTIMANKTKIIGTLGAAAIGKFVAKGFSTGTIAKLGPVRVKL
jgi:hypothetical protein|tara:strand:+ start:931 stop:1224 length:294 start_codon:yes stop_codon:yes gene_type:complete